MTPEYRGYRNTLLRKMETRMEEFDRRLQHLEHLFKMSEREKHLEDLVEVAAWAKKVEERLQVLHRQAGAAEASTAAGHGRRLRELERRSREVRAEVLRAVDEAEGTFALLWTVWIGPLWDRLIGLEKTLRSHEKPVRLPLQVHRAQDALLREALRRSGGIKKRAAQLMGVNLKTIYNWIQRMERRNVQKAPEALAGEYAWAEEGAEEGEAQGVGSQDGEDRRAPGGGGPAP